MAVRIWASAGVRPLTGASAAARCLRASLMIRAAATAAGGEVGRQNMIVPVET